MHNVYITSFDYYLVIGRQLFKINCALIIIIYYVFNMSYLWVICNKYLTNNYLSWWQQILICTNLHVHFSCIELDIITLYRKINFTI